METNPNLKEEEEEEGDEKKKRIQVGRDRWKEG